MFFRGSSVGPLKWAVNKPKKTAPKEFPNFTLTYPCKQNVSKTLQNPPNSMQLKMLRRRLRLSYSSDEEEVQPQQEQRQSPPVTHPPVTISPPYPYPSEPLPISSDDDDFMEVSDNLSPPSCPELQESDNRPPPSSSGGGCLISEFLQGLGLRLKREWLDACVQGLQQSVPGFRNLDGGSKAKLCFEQFLVSDMNHSGGGALPENVATLHLADLPGPYVLQVDEIVNISNPLKTRYQKANVGHKRCLKLSMTDGVQRVFGMEYRPIQALEALAPAGLKVVVCNVHIRHGLLMLVPESLEVLGGLVEELDAARQRLAEEVNKPPRGNRTRNGVVPPLATRAALAAWPPNGVHVAGHTTSSTLESPTPVQPPDHGATSSLSGRNTRPMTAEEFTFPLNGEHGVHNPSPNVVFGVEEMAIDSIPNRRETAIPHPSSDGFGVQELHISTVPYSREDPVPGNAIPGASFEDALDYEDIHLDADPFYGESRPPYPSSDAVLNDEDINVVNEGETHVTYPSSDAILNDEDNNVVTEVPDPLILSGDQELPFTYIACLSAKWAISMRENAHSVQGKVKCVLTGVKGFQYKQNYELGAYIDDGSLISEILIDHSLVQKEIGHSPEEVRAALSSADQTILSNMKQNMKQFQKFLTNFEGIMLIEINVDSRLPIALEMKQGCTESDTWLLLRRVKAFRSAKKSQHPSQ